MIFKWKSSMEKLLINAIYTKLVRGRSDAVCLDTTHT